MVGYTDKDRVLYYLILPHLKVPDEGTDENEDNGGGSMVELYTVRYKDEDYEADDFKELTDYIILNFEPGAYDIYKIKLDGTKEFYASFSFTSEEKRNLMETLPYEED